MARLLIIAHAPLATAFQAVAQHAFPELAASSVLALDVEPGMSADDVERLARRLLAKVGGSSAPPPQTGGLPGAALPPVALSPTQRALSQLAGERLPLGVGAPGNLPGDPPDDSIETLVLTDVFGATPANAAQRLADGVNIRMLCGINVPMLWRALNYAALPLADLVERSMSGASQGVVSINSTRPQNQAFQPNANDAQHHHHQQ
jgi:PTS system ascorbate-specific IIA component